MEEKYYKYWVALASLPTIFMITFSILIISGKKYSFINSSFRRSMGAKYNGFFCPYVSHSFNMPMKGIALIYLLLIYVFLSTTCSRQVFLDKNSVDTYKKDSRIHCISNIPSRFGVIANELPVLMNSKEKFKCRYHKGSGWD
jgi:hypothetical protein